MQIAYIFCYTLAYLSYFNNVGVPIEKKPNPGDNQFNFKLCRSNVTTSIILRPISKPTPRIPILLLIRRQNFNAGYVNQNCNLLF